MKRFLAILLLFPMILGLFACGGQSETSSQEPTSEDSSAMEASKEPFVADPKYENLRAFFGEEPDRTLKAKNLFQGLPYTTATMPLDNYILTDGMTHPIHDKTIFTHLEATGIGMITFDLGEGEHKLADIGVSCLKKPSYGIHLPTRVRVYISDDGEDYTEIASALPPADGGESYKYTFWIAFPGVVTARYIRLGISHNGEAAVDEIVGYEYCKTGTIDVQAGEFVAQTKNPDFYNYKLVTEITTPVSESDADYKTKQNLALLDGVSIGALHFEPLTEVYCTYNSTKEQLTKLINGAKAQITHYRDPEMVTFFRGTGRHVIIDLGNTMAVSGVGGEFLRYTGAGVRVPEFINVSLSTDGVNWVVVDDGKTGDYMKDGEALYNFDRKFGKSYLARYVRFSFVNQYSYETTVEVNCTELEVWGTKDTSNAVPASTPDGLIGGSYPDPEDIGFSALLWSCSGYVKDGHGFTYDNSLGYFAYLDDENNIKGRMFDSVVLGGLAKLRTPTDCKPAVEDFVTEFNTKDTNLDAIDQISKTILDTLHDDKKIVCWINLICPNSSFYCSDIDGDGKAEDFKNVDDCVKFLKWEVDLFVKAFKEANYQNIILGGFYWNNESIYKSDYDLQCETITRHNAYVHSLGLRSIWAPYYGAYGQWAWKDVGFDLSMLQSNYMFDDCDFTRLKSTADIALILGMGTELEIEDYTAPTGIDRYHEYLRAGYDYGYINAVNAIYQGSVPGALVRSREVGGYSKTVYDDTYLFLSGQLDETYGTPVPEDLSRFHDVEVTVASGKTAKFEIGELGNCHMRTLLSPVFGLIKINMSGDASFLSPDRFVGDINAVYDFYDNCGNHKTVNITIHVTEPEK